ncbi:SDR family NAD(P)-dependent oxidoreductase [Pseudoalteromonas sp. SSMSWG5]|jgi:NAD(P)-dependent dehydrogenase (short-subunit alcohol dehydrogenase family)|uniref:SDR family NAD(P)-dependent oxidoreductase n=1 Tax=unclassified Pseudoalteromonas TaxID=194690 RepID=UPI000C68832B|nr:MULTISPECIES: SDR family oxidoreductase [unclassified Pseudoalteromonas]MBD57983.1 short-chain dehydrogenase [Pseudoalteromonas sp.]MBU77286.1 short-chain dehydrogenase [Pseudoalteromonadaceae bacterium]MCO7249783.1 SDR family oxidoreductase [Pseudoalteromonas sp. Ps84H-4]TGV20437.1 SDR family oxidoreductase [Pseudoalteromonas sp. MEBiC 03607]|tara:strand:- start:684 stop:1460 length:777 start_codon:yes stop_codon:yes gene_type:complete
MNQQSSKKIALVTGGGSGIGRSICLRLAKRNMHILVVDLNIDAANTVMQEINENGGSAQAFAVDVANHQQVAELFATIKKHYAIDILINNAGIAHIGNIENTTESDLDRLYNINVKGVYNCMHAAIASMKEKQSGVIINLASVASSVGIADRFAYSMTKGAVLTMTYSVAKDYLSYGIRCNCIAPGRVHTPFVDNFLAQSYPDNQAEMFEKLSKSQPIGRMGKPEEIAGLVDYLCSDDAAFITGSNFPIDGGFVTLNN